MQEDYCYSCGSCCELLLPYCKNYDKDKRICKDYNNRPWMCIQQNFLGKEFAKETCNLLKHLKSWKDESNNKARCYRIATMLAMSLWGATKEQRKEIEKKIDSKPEEIIKLQRDSKEYEYALIKGVDMMLLNNCLVKALSETFNRSKEDIARIFVDGGINQVKGCSIPFKKAVEIAKSNNLLLDNIVVSKNPDGIWHAVSSSKEGFVPLLSIKIEDVDYIGEPLSAGMALIYSSLIGAGGGILGGMFGGGDDKFEQPEIQIKEIPEFPESEEARKFSLEKLKLWGGQPGYGAISPDWGDIWGRAKGKVSRYYWGGPGGTGQAGRIKAGAARRRVSESPAIDTLMTQMGQQEALQLGDIGVEQGLQEALTSEQGRQNWFSQMMQLSRQKPTYATSAGVTPPAGGGGTGELIAQLGGSIGTGIQQYGQNQWMQNLLKDMLKQKPQTLGEGYGPLGQASTSGIGTYYPS